MSGSKRLVVNLSETLERHLEKKSEEKGKKNSQYIKDAIILYIEERKKNEYIDRMKKGYMEMADINVEMAEMGCAEDFINLQDYEVWLTESDLPDDYDSETRRYILC
ncbi:MAG TPA: CopG family transcriptional regulator [Clostridium sp.]|jgi:CopG family transcriptional regulator/antitoxin EndoAI|nr:CopG family transcriptional regulator [Clostridia bacterium]HCW04861.1 CopG family transcriptional regulator [Clostridium sp.]